MKNFVLICICVLQTQLLFAQRDEFEDLIYQFDIYKYVNNLDNSKSDLFWNAVWRNNKRLNKLYKAITQEKTSALKAQNDLYNASLLSNEYYSNLSINGDYKFVADTLMNYIGIKSVFPEAEIYIINSDAINAYTCPNGKIYVTTGAIMCDSISVVGMVGICAHEAAHFFLQHSLDNAYRFRKRENRNKIISGVVSAIDATANAYAQANGAVGNESWDDVNERMNNLIEEAENEAVKYKYKYSREQEIEADIIAFRYLQWLGLDEKEYINALKTIGYDNDKFYNDKSTHPTTKFRVKFLEYLEKHKEIK